MAKNTIQNTQSTSISNQKTLFEKLNGNLEKNSNFYFYIILVLGTLLAFLSFNARISEAHDDSLYIEAGYRYVHEFPNYFYTSNAPMYSMFLAVLTLLFGTNLIYFKLFSILFYVIGAVLYYKALDKKIPEILKFFVFSFICLNYMIIYFASQTFSESFYMMIQAAFFYFFSKYNFSEKPLTTDLKIDLKKWLTLGFLMMLLTLAKNILVFGVVAIVLFFVLKKEWKKAIFSIAAFGVFKIIYEIIKNCIWGKSAIQYQSQMGILLNKDPYDASLGQEDIAGFFGRFFDNIGLYLGKRFYQIIGFMSEDTTQVFSLLSLLVLSLTFYGLYIAVKNKNDIVTFFCLFAGVICFGTFFVLQARWDQPRLLMVHMPALLLCMAYGLYQLFKKDTFNQTIFVGFVSVIGCSLLISSFTRASKNIPIVTKNLKGDIYFGYTPDWKNYLQMSAYCNDSLPKTALVAARKAPMSFVYGKGKHFFPIYSVIKKDSLTNQSNPDSALAFFRKEKVTHLLIASLRINPKQNTGEFINTLHNIAAPIAQKYPQKLKLVKEIGASEPAYLYEIIY